MLPADVVTPRLLRGWPLPEPGEGGDKYDRGTVLVVGGSTSTPGAVLLAGLAALRTGAGKLQILTVEATAVTLGVAVPEAAVVGLPAAPDGSLSPTAAGQVLDRSERASAVVLGPGLLDTDGAGELLRRVLPHVGDTPLLLDGVALEALAKDPGLLAGRVGLLTPNARELAALHGGEELADEAAAGLVSQRYDAVVSAPGRVAAPDGRRWSVEAGGVGLGTSGSGDVLAGLTGGLLACGAEPAQAGVWGQYLHSSAGDLLTARLGRVGFLARELLEVVPTVLGQLRP
ncbi:MAG: NAD(P)H-hydrate dehydratase [Mycobacteriales bacterium]